MPKQDSSLLDMLAKHPIFGWMRPKPREDGGDDDGEGGASMFCEPRPASTKRSSSPILLSLSERDSGALRTAPVSTCASNISTTCWSDQAITSNAVVGSSSSNSSTEEEEAVPTFQRLGFPEKARKAPKRPNLKIAALDSAPPVESSTPAAAAATPLVAIPWRLIDPDLATTPLEKALRHSLGQMEQRMMSGRHTRPNTTITTDPNRYSRKKSSMDHYDNHHHSSYHHRRTRSALPISRADAAARAIAIARGVLPDEDGRDEARRCGDSGINPPSSFWKSTPTAVDGFDTFNSSPCGGVRGGITEQEEREGFGGLEGDACPADSAPAPVAVSSQKLPADGAHEGGVDQAPVCDDGVDDDDDDDLMFEFDDLTM